MFKKKSVWSLLASMLPTSEFKPQSEEDTYGRKPNKLSQKARRKRARQKH
jgi:hypothetical protein